MNKEELLSRILLIKMGASKLESTDEHEEAVEEEFDRLRDVEEAHMLTVGEIDQLREVIAALQKVVDAASQCVKKHCGSIFACKGSDRCAFTDMCKKLAELEGTG